VRFNNFRDCQRVEKAFRGIRIATEGDIRLALRRVTIVSLLAGMLFQRRWQSRKLLKRAGCSPDARCARRLWVPGA